MNSIQVSHLEKDSSNVEVVERKGIGHPDMLCDIITEYLADTMRKAYTDFFNQDLYFDFSSSFLLPGKTKPGYASTGTIFEPIIFVLGGHAVEKFKGKHFNLDFFLKDTFYNFLENHIYFNFLNSNNITLENKLQIIKPHHKEISYTSENDRLLNNENWTSFGYGGKTLLEETVLKIEKFIMSDAVRNDHPEIGEDIRIHGFRDGAKYQITLYIAFVDYYVKNYHDYVKKKAELQELIQRYISQKLRLKPEIILNKLNEPSRFLTITGVSIENEGFGKTGQGNSQDCVISYSRPFYKEAAAGKHPLHIGKKYNLLAQTLAEDIFKLTKKKNYTWLYNIASRQNCQTCIADVRIEGFEKKDREIVQDVVKKYSDILPLFK